MAAERAERRLAAILAADVAGYSRLVGADEEGTLARLRALRRELIDPQIADHRGRIVKTTGDGLLVEFASVVDALRCAAAVQQAMAAHNVDIPPPDRIEFRVGIHQGDIVVADGDIFGDGVNIAARLEAIADPGGICVSARVQEDAAGRLDLEFDDLGEPELKNIARKVHVYRVALGPPASGRHAGGTPAVPSPAALPLPDKPSVAVLPFANMSSDPEQEFLADGIAEDVITALSRYPSLFVIARNSCLTYKGRAVEIRQVGRELGVRYVLEGGLRKQANRIRVTAQLVEAETGNHVWAERYDRELADIFAVQDEISQAVTIAIAPAIAGAELQRAMRKPPGNLDAWAAYQRGLWHLGKATPEDNMLARRYFEQAIDLDPGFAGGYAALAWCERDAGVVFAQRSLPEMQSLMEVLARRAVAIDAADAEGHACLGVALQLRGDNDGLRAEAERALALCPNLPAAHFALGAALIYSGRPKEGVPSVETSVRLDPRHPGRWMTMLQIAMGHYFANEYEAAVEVATDTIRSYPDFPLIHRWLAAALGQTGRIPEAREAVQKAMSYPSFDLYVRNRPPWMRPEDHAHMLEGLRKAGWEG